jgi:hypothetical protein
MSSQTKLEDENIRNIKENFSDQDKNRVIENDQKRIAFAKEQNRLKQLRQQEIKLQNQMILQQEEELYRLYIQKQKVENQNELHLQQKQEVRDKNKLRHRLTYTTTSD